MLTEKPMAASLSEALKMARADIELNLKAMAILDAGRRAVQSVKTELVNDVTWQLG